jgi:hypothetical protein
MKHWALKAFRVRQYEFLSGYRASPLDAIIAGAYNDLTGSDSRKDILSEELNGYNG